MLTVAEAQAIVLRQSRPLAPKIARPVLGAVLAEDIISDLDMPPHDKALMDGYAIRSADLAAARAMLTVIEEVTAGRMPARSLQAGQATRIMTGAPIPQGADVVVMIERTRPEGDRVIIEDGGLRPGQNIMRQGREMRRGETVLDRGSVLRPQELGVLATVGRATVAMHPAPAVAVLCTGDEIVEAAQTPEPGQIRNGNGPMLCAQVARAGGEPNYLGIARDCLDQLRPLVLQGLRADVLVLSGGVSAGKLDLVPGVLQEAGVAPHFHKVELKPGKPVFFGTRGETLVFGLPGNPVSALVCFELFVRPALRRLAGHADAGPSIAKARLAEDFAYRTDRPTYHPAWLDTGEQGWRVRAVPWHGSPDLRGLTGANAFVIFPPGDHQHQAGQVFEVLRVE
jgi:molybdopterin molybdotransferase